MKTQNNAQQGVVPVAGKPAPILQYRTSQGASGYAILRGRDARMCVLLTGRPLAENTGLTLSIESGTTQAARVVRCREGRSPGEFVLHLIFGDSEHATPLPKAM